MGLDHSQTTVVRTVDDDSVGETVISAVAAARGICPTEIETPLYEALDAHALDRLLSGGLRQPNLNSARIEFTWAGCTVVVNGTGRVVATPVDGLDESELLLG